jgi:hypothetical protein
MSNEARPERGTAAWQWQLADRIVTVAVDLGWLQANDDTPLTEGQIRNVRRLGAELAEIAREMCE